MSSGIRRRGKRAYQVQVEHERDPATGKRRRSYLTVHGSRADAERARNAMLHQRDRGIDIEPGHITVADFFERWLRDHGEPNLAPSTFELYRGVIRRRIIPEFGSLRLSKLRPMHLQSFYGRMLDETQLAHATVLQYHRLLHRALRDAVRWQLVPANPADAVNPPRRRPTEMHVLDQSGVRALLVETSGTPIDGVVRLALATGMRQGELLALRWADVDFTTARIHVQRSARYFAGSGVKFSPPKTHRSRRPVALSAQTIDMLRAHRATQHERRLQLGGAWPDYDLVFPSAVGTPANARNLGRAFAAAVARAGVGPLRFHDLRHTAATLMLRAGIHPKVVAERLGHSRISITLDTYSHVLPDMQEEAAEALDAYLA